MFDNLKKMKELKDSLAEESFEAEKRGAKVVLNGNMEIEDISLNPELSKEDQEEAVKECFNEVLKKAQSAVARKFQGII